MSTQESTRRWIRNILCGIFLCLLLGQTAVNFHDRLRLAFEPYDIIDAAEAQFLVQGLELWKGRPLYPDPHGHNLINNLYTPLMPALLAPYTGLGGDSLAALRPLLVVLLLGIALQTFCMIRPRAGVWAALAGACLVFDAPLFGVTLRTDIMMVFFSTLAIFWADSWKGKGPGVYGIALATACMFLTKQSSLVTVIAVGLALTRHGWRSVAQYLAVLSAAVAVVLFCYGRFSGGHMGFYLSAPSRLFIADYWRVLYTKVLMERIPLLLVFGLLGLAARALARDRSYVASDYAIIGWFIFTFLSMASSESYEHYFAPAVPPLALSAATWLRERLKAERRGSPLWAAALLAIHLFTDPPFSRLPLPDAYDRQQAERLEGIVMSADTPVYMDRHFSYAYRRQGFAEHDVGFTFILYRSGVSDIWRCLESDLRTGRYALAITSRVYEPPEVLRALDDHYHLRETIVSRPGPERYWYRFFVYDRAVGDTDAPSRNRGE